MAPGRAYAQPMRALALVLLAAACCPQPRSTSPAAAAPAPASRPSDPYEAPTLDTLSHTPGCDIPFGSPEQAHIVADGTVSALTVCPRGGFVTVTGRGQRAVYGKAEAAIAPPAGCAVPADDDPERAAFWQQVRQGMRDKSIVQNGFGLHLECDGSIAKPEGIAVGIVDWADLDATVAIVVEAMRAHDICGPLVIAVHGVECTQLL